MFSILRFLLIAFVATVSLSWMLEHKGSVVVNWLGYELQTNILTAFSISAFCAWVIFIVSHFITKILTIHSTKKKLQERILNKNLNT